MPFEFVDNTTPIDGHARKRIRRHVAVGRNAGRTISRPSRKQATVVRPETYAVRNLSLLDRPKSNVSTSAGIERQIGDGLSVMCIPASLRPGFRRVVQRALSFFTAPRHVPELSSVIDDAGYATSMWVQFIFLDEAYFHCAIAMSVTAMNNLVTRPDDASEALQHVSKSLQTMRKRLTGHDAASDTNIAVVIAMTQFERHQGEYHRGSVHLGGLLQMVELRGGISSLTAYKPSLTQKIFRADLEFSLYLGTATRLRIEDVILGSTAVLSRQNHSQNTFAISDTLFFGNFRIDLQDLLLDTVSLTQRVNIIGTEKRQKFHSYSFHDTVILLGYRIIHISPLGGLVSDGGATNTAHLGLAAFLLTFLRRLDYRISEMPLLYSLTKEAVRSFDDEDAYELLLWVLCIGSASIFTPADDIWLLPIVVKVTNILHLHTWQDIVRTLITWPWVNVLHDRPGEALWNRSVHCASVE